MDSEAKAIQAAIGAEMSVYLELLVMRVGMFYADPSIVSAPRLDSLRVPPPTVWPKVADKVGLLPPELVYETVRAWSLLEIHAVSVNATIEEAKSGQWKGHWARDRANLLKQDLDQIAATASALSGRPVDETLRFCLL